MNDQQKTTPQVNMRTAVKVEARIETVIHAIQSLLGDNDFVATRCAMNELEVLLWVMMSSESFASCRLRAFNLVSFPPEQASLNPSPDPIQPLVATQYDLPLGFGWPYSVVIRLENKFKHRAGQPYWAIIREFSKMKLFKKVSPDGYFHFGDSTSESLYDDFGFATPEEAYEFWVKNRPKILATPEDLQRKDIKNG